MPVNLWDVCKERAKSKTVAAGQKDTTLLFLGSKETGKTTLINHFVGKLDEAAKPTLALEYSYCLRQTNNPTGGGNEICHLWELQGGTAFSSLLEAAISIGNIKGLSIILMLDLSQPKILWSTMEILLKDLRSRLTTVLTSSKAKEENLQEELLSNVMARFGDHQEKHQIEPFPVPFVILGSKYDIFQNFDPEEKKVMCRCLRNVAHSLGASLQFYSCKDTVLLKRARDLLSHYAFNTAPLKIMSTDYNKPLVIPAGSDSFSQIDNKGAEEESSSGHNFNLWRHTFTSLFPQEKQEKLDLPDDPAINEKYPEPDVDNLRKQKDEDLQRYLRELERKRTTVADLL
ncbi:unnamed protein product [Darwinula stevensoni]|uniref:Cytoplasmic dynein 2 light intermediate chain 1 n=1 Tax=Darwinula stevensoni TaxID=69355 RepID=A0A7R9FRD5_9CRUS|nr:unnamed protein product [Darwinula stevensoni]CAG0901462.1 unnamed protein product [Darwinula stevensoni]